MADYFIKSCLTIDAEDINRELIPYENLESEYYSGNISLHEVGVQALHHSLIREEDKRIMKEIFVFGSNLAGRHGKGAALHARQHHGAIYGQGEGLQGRSYAIPTKTGDLVTLPLWVIEDKVRIFLEFAINNPRLTFDVTPIGCGLAGYKYSEIAPFFSNRVINVNLPKEFLEVLNE